MDSAPSFLDRNWIDLIGPSVLDPSLSAATWSCQDCTITLDSHA